jgi:hypothetical protein
VADDVILIFLMVFLIRGAFRGPLVEMFSAAGTLCSGCLWHVGSIHHLQHSSLLILVPINYGGWSFFFRCSSPSTYLLSMLGCRCPISGTAKRRTGWLIRLSGAGLGICNGVLLIAVFLVPLITFFPQQVASDRSEAGFPLIEKSVYPRHS